MFLTVCMNPTIQKTLRFTGLVTDRVNRTSCYRTDPSGKGVNVSRVLSQLGKQCLHLTQLGGPLRPLFLDLCGKDRIPLQWVESESPIRFCYTLINDADRSVTELVEEAEPVAAGTEGRLMEAYQQALGGVTWVIISGTKAAGFSDDAVPEMVRAAKAAGKKVLLDLRGEDLRRSLRYKPDIIKPNLSEFIQTFAPEDAGTGGGGALEGRIRRIALGLAGEYQCRVVLTRGAEPVWFAEGSRFSEAAFEPAPPVNTTGSGDAFTAGLAAALETGAALADAVLAGIACGACNARLFRVGAIQG
ncbi:MAG: PfkB family carbohydrate kinase [Spirochaetaceae bacterium]|jgi:1-phosphofructokinase/tagatose 6-phosphate kinase|nr:PfkB family carbohydrate kinase [Spirochaetaceae bacterium]